MKKWVVLTKPVGQTPLEAITSWKEKNPQFATVPASYAGRLDPMASGNLLVLLGEECKRQKEYTKLDKEYEIEIVLGVGSDTGDALGMIVPSDAEEPTPTAEALSRALQAVQGTHTVPYPAYSSKTVAGKPLFLYALEGALGTISIPTHDETILSIVHTSTASLSTPELRARIQKFLALTPRSTEPSKALGADFRIDAVRASWEPVLASERTWHVLRLRVACTSGTYMRTLAGRLARELGTTGLALSIHRTRIGRYLPLLPYFGIWLSQYK